MKLHGSIKKGEVWKTDSRKGLLTVKVLENIKDVSKDDFFEVEIVEGKAKYASQGNQLQQRVHGLGTPGDVISMRTTLTTFMEKVK